MQLPYSTAIALLGIYSRKTKIYVYTKTYTRMFIAALFTVAKNWIQSTCPSTDEWL